MSCDSNSCTHTNTHEHLIQVEHNPLRPPFSDALEEGGMVRACMLVYLIVY